MNDISVFCIYPEDCQISQTGKRFGIFVYLMFYVLLIHRVYGILWEIQIHVRQQASISKMYFYTVAINLYSITTGEIRDKPFSFFKRKSRKYESLQYDGK